MCRLWDAGQGRGRAACRAPRTHSSGDRVEPGECRRRRAIPARKSRGGLGGYAVDSGGPGRPRMWPLFHRQQKARDDVSSPRDPQGPPTTNVGTGQCRALWVMKQPLARMQKTGPG